MLDPLVDASPWLLLASGAAFFLLMANALWPLRHPLLMFQSFLAGLTVRETAAHHLAWQVPFVGLLVVAGALREWLGIVGLVLVGLSWVGLVGLFVVAHRDAARVRAQGDPGQEPAPSYPVAYLAAPPLAFLRRDISVQRGIVFGEAEGVRLRLDVFRPRAQGRLRPAVVQVHGGGWVSGFKRAQGVPLLGQLASLGWVGFNIDYRLGPRAAFPAHLVDVKRAIAWLRDNAERFGIDPGFVALTGQSAGGHLTALAALTQNDPVYQPGFEDADTSVQAAVPLYGVYDLTDRFGHWVEGTVDNFLVPWVMKSHPDEDPEAWAAASPMDRVHPGAPPMLVIHGDKDSLAPVEDARHFADELSAVSENPVHYLELAGAQHAFEIFPSIRANAVTQGIEKFLCATHRAHVHRNGVNTT